MDGQSWLFVFRAVNHHPGLHSLDSADCPRLQALTAEARAGPRRAHESDRAGPACSPRTACSTTGEDRTSLGRWPLDWRWRSGLWSLWGRSASPFLRAWPLGFHEEIWVVAGMVGLGGVLCGGLLAGQTFGANRAHPSTTTSSLMLMRMLTTWSVRAADGRGDKLGWNEFAS